QGCARFSRPLRIYRAAPGGFLLGKVAGNRDRSGKLRHHPTEIVEPCGKGGGAVAALEISRRFGTERAPVEREAAEAQPVLVTRGGGRKFAFSGDQRVKPGDAAFQVLGARV